MDTLPIEMIIKIFGYLDFQSLLAMRLQLKLFIVWLIMFREMTFYESRLFFRSNTTESTYRWQWNGFFTLVVLPESTVQLSQSRTNPFEA